MYIDRHPFFIPELTLALFSSTYKIQDQCPLSLDIGIDSLEKPCLGNATQQLAVGGAGELLCCT